MNRFLFWQKGKPASQRRLLMAVFFSGKFLVVLLLLENAVILGVLDFSTCLFPHGLPFLPALGGGGCPPPVVLIKPHIKRTGRGTPLFKTAENAHDMTVLGSVGQGGGEIPVKLPFMLMGFPSQPNQGRLAWGGGGRLARGGLTMLGTIIARGKSRRIKYKMRTEYNTLHGAGGGGADSSQ